MCVCMTVVVTVIGGESETRTDLVGSQIRCSQCENEDLTIQKIISLVNLVLLGRANRIVDKTSGPPRSDSITETSGLQVVCPRL